jgi:hypothetical protein
LAAIAWAINPALLAIHRPHLPLDDGIYAISGHGTHQQAMAQMRPLN